MKNEAGITIIPLGGLEAIGKNITLFEYEGDIIIVDCGIMFPTDEMPGIDFIIPDFTYLVNNRDRVKGIIITHGHEDHIGAIPYLLKEVNVPIYATKLTIGLIQSRLEEIRLKVPPVFHEVMPRGVAKIGKFTIEFIKVNHSIIDGVGLAIKTDIGTIIHTGDFKIDFSPVDGLVTDLTRFADYGEKGVLLLMSDSTNADRPGYTKSESVLNDRMVDIFSNSKGRIIVATFASNIHRIQQVMDVAQRFNRKVVISGLTMQKNVEIATALGYLSYKDDLVIDIHKANHLANKKLVVIGTGSQGEPMSALARMANGSHRHFYAEKGDTVIITASVIPGNERTVNYVVNSLMKLGAEVYYERDTDIHVSGHGSAEELKLILSLTKPKFFMPVHGEYRMLKAHAQLAESLNIKTARILIAENGDVLELTGKSFKKTGTIPLATTYIDGKHIGDLDSSVIKDRQLMSSDGIFVVTLVIAEGMLMRPPEVLSRGFSEEKSDKTVKLIHQAIEEKINPLLIGNAEPRKIEQELFENITGFVFKSTRRNPLVVVQVLEV